MGILRGGRVRVSSRMGSVCNPSIDGSDGGEGWKTSTLDIRCIIDN
jgi:hypothetical protein